jgi:hypothetical protein
MKVDENYYKDMMKLWTDFSDNMNHNLSNINHYEKGSYNQWYDYWLDYSDKVTKEFTEAFQRQFEQGSEIYDTNDLWFNKLGFSKDQQQKFIDTSKLMSEYWFGVINQATNLIQDYSNPEKSSEFPLRFQEFYKHCTESCSELLESIMELMPQMPTIEPGSFLSIVKDSKSEDRRASFDPLGMGMVQKFILDNMKLFSNNNKYDYDKIYDELVGLRSELDQLTDDVEKLTNSSGEYNQVTGKGRGRGGGKGRGKRK